MTDKCLENVLKHTKAELDIYLYLFLSLFKNTVMD